MVVAKCEAIDDRTAITHNTVFLAGASATMDELHRGSCESCGRGCCNHRALSAACGMLSVRWKHAIRLWCRVAVCWIQLKSHCQSAAAKRGGKWAVNAAERRQLSSHQPQHTSLPAIHTADTRSEDTTGSSRLQSAVDYNTQPLNPRAAVVLCHLNRSVAAITKPSDA